MKPVTPPLITASRRWAVLILIGSVVIASVVLATRHKQAPSREGSLATMHPSAVLTNAPAETTPTHPVSAPAGAAGVLSNYPDFQQRPFPVAYESPGIQWTLADGKDTNVIRQLAHNHLEYDRMVEENSRIFKRQLVYLKETAAAVFEQAKLTGAPVRQLMLPGVEGQELQFEIVKGDNHGSSRQGSFSGHLAGNTDSLVTLAFLDGREAFTVLSPKDNVYVVGEPREDGQVIVKAIDPDTYGRGPEQKDDTVKSDSTQK